jgi:hypothetical protein
MKHLLLLTCACALLAPAGLAAAEIGCPAPSRPLLEVVATASSSLSLDGAVSSGGALLCTGGAVTQVNVQRDAFVLPGAGLADALSELPDFVVILTGVVPAPARSALGAALGAAEVGSARDCRLASPGTIDTANRITWHGRRGRRNTFTVTTDALGLPPCSAEVETLVAAIYAALLEAGSSESASVLVID